MFLSFFDDDDEPTRSTGARPRRAPMAGRVRGGGGSGGGGHDMDAHERQQLLIRRAVAGGIALFVLFVLIFGIKSCLDSSNESAMKDYNRSVTDIMTSSDDGQDRGTALQGAGGRPDRQPAAGHRQRPAPRRRRERRPRQGPGRARRHGDRPEVPDPHAQPPCCGRGQDRLAHPRRHGDDGRSDQGDQPDRRADAGVQRLGRHLLPAGAAEHGQRLRRRGHRRPGHPLEPLPQQLRAGWHGRSWPTPWARR